MGDVADMMLDGTLCQGCGVFLNEDAPGYPCSCRGCRIDEKKAKAAAYQPPKPKAKCAVCGRKVKPTGLPDHMRDAHKEPA
ncbi:hypothetical protein [Collimonas sp. PA-H2]|uniref:hypothetical protein n=1 Tax=Collimonas sp. PA-H2 TaxID=1881062 RepID=UPI000BF42250|nr:hypothetical protein [Collimonas sp. PA-H2]